MHKYEALLHFIEEPHHLLKDNRNKTKMRQKFDARRTEIKRCQLWRQPKFEFTFDQTARHYTFELDSFELYCQNCDIYFRTENDYHLHLIWTLQIRSCQREIDHITRVLARLGYSVDEKMNLYPSPVTLSTRRKLVPSVHSKPSTTRQQMVIFVEHTFQQRLNKKQKRLEKLKRQFAAFNIK